MILLLAKRSTARLLAAVGAQLLLLAAVVPSAFYLICSVVWVPRLLC
jgi:hypothetical protein